MISDEKDLISHYLTRVKKAPLLSPEEEFQLAKQWREKGDHKAVDRLLTSHLRLVNKVATGYRGYGMPISDLIAEGNIGMMHAIKHFDPERGFRFSTYAMWWIKAQIQEYILRSWSLVKIGTTSAQKKLFFNLRKAKRAVEGMATHEYELTQEMVQHIAEKLGVKEHEVREMNQRISGGDHSLNVPMRDDGERESEWMEWIADERDNPEIEAVQRDEMIKRRTMLDKAMATLTERERLILVDRRLTEPPHTLEALADKYNISRERIRQIEVRAFEKLQRTIKKLHPAAHPHHI